MDIAQLGKEYGWSIAMLIFILDKVYPQAFSWFTKSQQKKFTRELEEAKAERDDRIAERQFRHDLDERQVKAYEELVRSNQLQAQLLITLNERMNTLNTTQNNMSRFLNESIAHMMEVRAAKDKTDK